MKTYQFHRNYQNIDFLKKMFKSAFFFRYAQYDAQMDRFVQGTGWVFSARKWTIQCNQQENSKEICFPSKTLIIDHN